ncbi:MAG TPA: hypothetical protein VML55_09665 [Planctomycetaceae bacterium]|nr:hypothetical protein [Planctomycetaceae bacterium]
MPEAQKPRCVAMVLCDAVHRDAGNGKFTLLGIFDRLLGRAVPIKAQFCVFFVLTDCVGETEIGIRIVDSRAGLSDDFDTSPIIDSPPVRIRSSDPLAAIKGVVGMTVDFPESGVYLCELYSGEVILQHQRVVVSGPRAEGDERQN